MYFGIASTPAISDNKNILLKNKKEVIGVIGSTERLNISKLEKHYEEILKFVNTKLLNVRVARIQYFGR